MEWLDSGMISEALSEVTEERFKTGARLMGSPDIYSHKEREPEQSINL
jgi:hypothetical protein